MKVNYKELRKKQEKQIRSLRILKKFNLNLIILINQEVEVVHHQIDLLLRLKNLMISVWVMFLEVEEEILDSLKILQSQRCIQNSISDNNLDHNFL